MSSVTEIRAVPPLEPASTATAPAAAAVESVQWRSWPLVDDRRRIWPLAALVVVVLMVVASSTGSLLATGLIAAAFAAATWRIWLPIRYEVNSRGVVQLCCGRVRHVNWSMVRRVEILPHGLRLFKYAEPGPFDAWRALYVPWGDHEAEVIAIVEQAFQISTAENHHGVTENTERNSK
jgi:hypothetical protein